MAKGTPDEPDRPPRFDEAAAAEFASIDEALATIRIPYEEWEVLYRQRLQVERDLRAGAMAGEAVVGADTPGIDGPAEALASVARILRQGASALVEAATDDETVEALDKLAGPRWRLAAQAADVALVAARAAVRGADGKDDDVRAPKRKRASRRRSGGPTRTTTNRTKRTRRTERPADGNRRAVRSAGRPADPGPLSALARPLCLRAWMKTHIST